MPVRRAEIRRDTPEVLRVAHDVVEQQFNEDYDFATQRPDEYTEA